MDFDQNLLGSVTVWYNPQTRFVNNINSYSRWMGLLVVIDNSEGDNQFLFDKISHPNKIYVGNRQNMGIAKALNQGITLLKDKGYEFALTLDQDSSFEIGEFSKLLNSAQKLDWTSVGILSPIHIQQKSTAAYNTDAYTPITCVMTSGNILNLNIAGKLGLFKEALFIDHVDNEFCLRLNANGYKVLVANSFLSHELGDYKSAYFLSVRIGGFISHSPQRLYYFVRNALYIISNYPFVNFRYTLTEISSLIKRFFKIFFEDNKALRFKAYFKGISDYGKLK